MWTNLEELYARHSRSVYRRARMLLRDDEAARDLTQEVFMRLMRAPGKVPAQPTVTAWLHCVTTNLCLNQLRDRTRHNVLLATTYRSEGVVASQPETRITVMEILARIPEDLQEVAVYFFLDELTYDEIAELLGVSRRTVGKLLSDFRERVGRLFPDLRAAS
jgi:RNA polymerase sigma-70 factor (ECF subfamily)